MPLVKPFKALRPAQNEVKQVVSLPYDVMNRAEAKSMAANQTHSFLHVSRAEIDLPESVDIHSAEVYQKAATNFSELIQKNILKPDEKACYYIYEQIMEGRSQVGLVGCSSIEDYFSDKIKKHEFTRPEKELDRIEHMRAVKAHVGPIFLTHRVHLGLEKILNDWKESVPAEADFKTEDQVTHRVWKIDQDSILEKIQAIFEKEIEATYIADGHHRTASAAKVGLELKNANPNHNGTEEYNFFLSVIFPDSQLAILDYNRVVKDLNGHTVADFLNKLETKFVLSKTTLENAKPTKIHQFSMYLDKTWYLLEAKENTFSLDPIGVLDVTILQENVLSKLLDIHDPRTDTRIDFVGGIRGIKALQERVDSGEMAVAFAVYPVSLQQLFDIADSGNVMPPKSTWFEPKLRDGFFCHLF